jgi:integrase
MTLLAPTLQAFFTQRLITQRNASPHTIASYRDTFRLLLAFAQHHTGKQPHQLDFDDLDAPLIGAFLTHLEHDRHNSARTRNNQLAAIHSLYRYAALEHPEHAATIARVMAIPTKRYQRKRDLLPDPRRDQGVAQSPGPHQLARAPRPRAHAPGDPDRAARLRTHIPANQRHQPDHRRARARDWERRPMSNST